MTSRKPRRQFVGNLFWFGFVVIFEVTTIRTANRFAVAIHILSLLESLKEGEATSDYLAGSIGVNPVEVRNVSGMLRRAGLIETRQGVPGARLSRAVESITLRDVYQAVETDDELFGIHTRPNPNCPAGAHIQASLEEVFSDAERALSDRLAQTTIADVVFDLARRGGA